MNAHADAGWNSILLEYRRIEVIIDVAFNHTMEAGHNGPTLGLRDRQQRVRHPGTGPFTLVRPIFFTRFIVSVARLFLLIDSRSRGCGEVGSA
jgi:hypothetical protein